MISPATLFTLPNGMRVIHQQDSAAAMVALTVLYNTGARDEDPSLTGLAHLIEHLMFSGSAHVDDFDGELQLAGGTSNAWTSNDFTCFYQIVPAVNAEIAFRLESDRMLAPAIGQENLDVQRSVVIEEFKQQCLNRPYGDMSHHLRALAYDNHPYRWPVIGSEPSHLERMTLEDVQSFFNRCYSPSNAVMAVTGNIDLDSCQRLALKWMGDIPSRPLPERHFTPDPLPVVPRLAEVTGKVPFTAITLAYPMDRYGTTAYYAADAISDILANGRSARFYRNLLLGTNLFTEIDASILGSEDPGLFLINARLRDNSPEAEARAIQAIDSEIEKLVTDGATAHELQRAKNKFESNYTFSNLLYSHRGQTLATEVLHGEQPGECVTRYNALTLDDISTNARSLFNPLHRSTLIYRPTKD